MAVPILWRNRRQRYSLEGEVCSACERAVFPPRQVCPYCSRERQEESLAPILALPELQFDPARLYEINGEPVGVEQKFVDNGEKAQVRVAEWA